MDLVFKNVSVEIEKKPILKNVTGMARQGELVAIMGPSGAGKSTLLNVLAARKEIKRGVITLDNKPIRKDLKRKICYVMQSDIFFPNLTLMETLTYTATLRLPEKMSPEVKKERVEEIIDVLDLHNCRDTAMGGVGVPGLSGGEMKRASIACEMLVNPQVLLLDEPTSGLDAAIAFSVMTIMHKYAKQFNKTVISTIHQPSSQIFYMFDNVMLLTSGKVAFFGTAEKVVHFFSSVGLVCKPHYNPADFIMEKIKESEEIEQRIVEHYKETRQEYAPNELFNQTEEEEKIETNRHKSVLDLFRLPKRKSKSSMKETQPSEAALPRRQSMPVLSKVTELGSPKFEIRSSTNEPAPERRLDGLDRRRSFAALSAVGEANMGFTPSIESTTRSDKLESLAEDEHEGVVQMLKRTLSSGSSGGRSVVVTVENGDAGPGTPRRELSRQDTDLLVEQYYDETAKWQTGFWTQYSVLTRRTLRQSRHRILSSVNLVRGFIMAALSGVFWFQLPREEATINDRLGVIFFLTTFWSFQPMFDAILSFPAERQVINRERSSGAYRLSAYYCAKMTSEIPLMLAMPTAFHAIVYWMAGLAPTARSYLQSIGLLLFHAINSQSIGLCIGIAIEDYQRSITVGALSTLGAYLTAGYLQRSMPSWIAWSSILSFVRYPFHALTLTEFNQQQLFKCSNVNLTIFPECFGDENATDSRYVDGLRVLQSLEMDTPLWIDVVVLLIFVIILRTFGYITLRYINNPNRNK